MSTRVVYTDRAERFVMIAYDEAADALSYDLKAYCVKYLPSDNLRCVSIKYARDLDDEAVKDFGEAACTVVGLLVRSSNTERTRKRFAEALAVVQAAQAEEVPA